ncbi:carbon-nitrogen hydrolase [Dipodascopsis tothii]|uniref:carbon-nitrogen hydrolase n=1 Tax=Dipodascopsis tothii TaxID=44089 RepID=UPI0034CDB42B
MLRRSIVNCLAENPGPTARGLLRAPTATAPARGFATAPRAMTLAAAGQFCATSSPAANLAAVRALVRQAAAVHARVLFLPEASDYIAGSPAETVALAEPVESSLFVTGLQAELRALGTLAVSVGVHEPAGERVKNTLLYLDETGAIVHRYQKVHLFDVAYTDGPVLNESRSVEPGTAVEPPFATPLGAVGPAICYDIRFPEQALRLRSLGADIIVYPSAFTVLTGQAHWEVLGRARAIDTQSYVIMAAQVGAHDAAGTRRSWGHAMIVDPWGTVLAQCASSDPAPRICVADIDLSVVARVRKNMPLWTQRRPDVFGHEV